MKREKSRCYRCLTSQKPNIGKETMTNGSGTLATKQLVHPANVCFTLTIVFDMHICHDFLVVVVAKRFYYYKRVFSSIKFTVLFRVIFYDFNFFLVEFPLVQDSYVHRASSDRTGFKTRFWPLERMAH